MFYDFSKEIHQPFNNFLDPLLKYKRNNKNNKFKAYGKDYLLYLIQSKEFKNQFLKFLNGDVFYFYRGKIISKMNGMKGKLEGLYNQNSSEEYFLSSLKNYILQKR